MRGKRTAPPRTRAVFLSRVSLIAHFDWTEPGLARSPSWNLSVAETRFPPDTREGRAGPEADIGWEGLLKLRPGCPPRVWGRYGEFDADPARRSASTFNAERMLSIPRWRTLRL